MNRITCIWSTLILLVFGGMAFFLNIGDWLTISEDPEKAELIICLNGDQARLPKAVELFKQGVANHILVTSSSMRQFILRQGVPETAVTALSGPNSSTYEEARSAVQYMGGHKVRYAVVVSDSYHLYRARWTFERLKESQTFQFSYAAANPISENRQWWSDRKSRKFVLNEIPKVVYYWVGHGLLGIETDPHWVNAAESWYNKFLNHIVSTTCLRTPIS